ncbi:SprT-like domain-containing protein [Muribaculum intestinale]|uniref:SprT-like domain-containing protein n=1 Tax=Muribaculum intestinale TaxID=1796646 RepID=UPI003517241F
MGNSEKYQTQIFVLELGNSTLTKSELKRMHSEYNQMYFGGRLSMPDFKFINAKRPFGRFRADKKTSEIGISAYRKGWSEEFLKDTLIHEMIHQYVYECMSGCRYSLVQHGLQFHFMRCRLKRKYGLNISGGAVF